MTNSAYASQRTIGRELSSAQVCIVMHRNVWFAGSSRAPALWRRYRDVNNQNMAMLPIFHGWLPMFTEEKNGTKMQCKHDENMSI